jgi:hypothetical protein
LYLKTNRDNQIEELKEKNEILQNEINQINSNLQIKLNETREQLGDYAKQSVKKNLIKKNRLNIFDLD